MGPQGSAEAGAQQGGDWLKGSFLFLISLSLLLLLLWAGPLSCPVRAPPPAPQIQSNLGKIILKEELEKSAAPLRRKTRSLPDRSQHAGTLAPPCCCHSVVDTQVYHRLKRSRNTVRALKDEQIPISQANNAFHNKMTAINQ